MQWYEESTGNHQGLVIDEQTGENIAVTYDKKHARLISATPDLFNFASAIDKVMASKGHNLNSTATRAERSKFISDIIDAWNTFGYTAVDKVTE